MDRGTGSCTLFAAADSALTQTPPKRRSFRLVNVFLTITAILLSSLYLLLELPLRAAREEWRQGRPAAALDSLRNWRRMRMRPSDFDDGIAVSLLTLGRLAEADPYLERLKKRPPVVRPFLAKDEVARVLVSRGRYEEFLRFEAAANHHVQSSDLPLYRAAAQLGVGRIDDAVMTFSKVERDDVDAQKFDALRTAIEERKKGIFTLVFDRGGKAIAQYSTANDDLVAVNRDFAGLVEREAGKLTIENQLKELGTASSIETTLDSAVQSAALQALGGQRGGIVVIDVASNEILALASNTPGSLSNLALETEFEPGSIIKVVTLLAALENGLDVTGLFPFECKGFLEIEKRQFFDWAPHGKLATVDDAMAVSCNLAFADIGRRIGREKQASFFRSVGFDSVVDLGITKVRLGRIRQPFYTEFELATATVGLEHETINVLHIAMLARMIATGGDWTGPTLLRGRRSLLGEQVSPGAAAIPVKAVSAESARRATQSMSAVVTSARGTGRRAAVEGTTIAMKTGTAGSPSPAYDALVMAFTPVDKPKYAIGIIAQHAGPAEYAGSKIVNALVESLSARKQ